MSTAATLSQWQDNEHEREKYSMEKVDVDTKIAPVGGLYDIIEDESAVDPIYTAKAKILSDAFQEIGMGKYQVRPSGRAARLQSQFCTLNCVLISISDYSGICLSSQVSGGSREWFRSGLGRIEV